jgi:cobalt/nickel transport protein
MRKISVITMVVSFIILGWIGKTSAHFGMIIPSDDIITQKDKKIITLEVKLIHPMQKHYMEMKKPKRVGVRIGGRNVSLLKTLKSKRDKWIDQRKYFTYWKTTYRIKRPADYIFYVQPKPYWEPAEDCFIIHYTKVCVHALGLEQGWDDEVGLPIEIIPLTRPYGLWTGNVFTGVVKLKGKPVPFAEIEVEYYNKNGKIKPPSDPYITQVIKADKNGVFTYTMPKAGWWGFAALSTASYKLKGPDGKKKPVEIGAVYWIKVRDMR